MPNLLENFGLELLIEDENTMMKFMMYLAQNGKAITGYYGEPTLFTPMGDIDFFLKTKINEKDHQLEIIGLDTHCCGKVLWEMRNTGINLTPKNSSPTERLYLFKQNCDGFGVLPIHMINADVLPSFLENDIVNMQVCALPLKINYYADQKQYEENQPCNDEGKRWLVADGSLFPAAFLYNHSLDNMNTEKNFLTDDHILFTATVKALYHGVFEMNGKKENTFIRCIADTQYGELNFVHSIDQVLPDQLDNLHIGAVISGTCILSGDVAIRHYENGFVKDSENNFKLVRQVITKGEAERLKLVLSEDSIYISESSNKIFYGKDEIIARLNYVHNNQKDQCFTHAATITKVDSMDLEYTEGIRCIILAYNTEDNYEAIVFIDTDDSGNITRLLITTDKRYHFKIDDPPQDKVLFDDIALPENIFIPIFNRACFHGMIDDNIEIDEYIKGMDEERFTWENNAKRMLDALKMNPPSDTEKTFQNIFGYLFAKEIEKTINTNKNNYGKTPLVTGYSFDEALNGEISSTFDEKDHQILVKAMEKGKQFFKDFKFFIKMIDASEDQFKEEMIKALVFVQYIGSNYAWKLYK